jgi:nitrogen fixation/metabolism regulation signal transduction histidine kinase
MRFKHYFIVSFFFALCFGGGAVFFFTKSNINFACIFLIVTLFLVYYALKFMFKIFRDIDDFVEAVKYRDFSKRYTETGSHRNNFYKYFNAISDAFLTMSREKEAQQQYLKRILELVNTGILAYDMDTLETLWMNDSFKNMFQIPYVKNIGWLKKRHPKLYEELNKIELGDNRLATINAGNRTIKTLCNASTFQTDGKTYMLIAFHNISATLEEVESGAWKGLLNVMTHEIMNSIAPVASLADTLKKRMELMKEELNLQSSADFEDMESAMETIRRRSEGLLRFADTYRSLSKNIVPEIQPVNLHELLSSIYRLMHPSLEQKGILLEVKTDNSSAIAHIDRNLIEQVVINFITNATFAVKDKKESHIVLFSGVLEEKPYFTVADNGCGISPEIQEKMFIPFFSTKKSGTGIGLSLSREIIKMHNGNLQLQTKEG